MSERRRSRFIRWLLALTLPILLLALNLRLVTGHWFVRWEYGRTGFPPDPFGLSTEQRIRLASVCQDFLASNADISLLADVTLESGEPAFNERELRHMSDVQVVYRAITLAGVLGGLTWLGVGIGLATFGRATNHVSSALLTGGLVTLGLLAGLGVFMVASWRTFFTTFHRIFFEGNTWIFPNSDTLIRLFPIRFWIDIAATLVGLLTFEAFILGVVGWFTRPTRAPRGSGPGRA